MTRASTACWAALAAAMIGCAHAPPPQELVDARATYKQAASGPASRVPDQLAAAKKELARAESVFAKHGDGPPARDAAYLATRRAQLADAAAKTAVATQERETAERAAIVAQAAAFERTQYELERAQRARADADVCKQEAFADLERTAWVKREDRGVVITLPGGGLFRTGEHRLLPESAVRLDRVARALTRTGSDAEIVVEGHTDAKGDHDRNVWLSHERAEAVARYLVAHGVAQSRVTVLGIGPERPLGDNRTPQGRTLNRRVEIIVQDLN